MLTLRFNKLRAALASPGLRRALFKHRVLAATEHRAALNRSLTTIVDIGANRGQFALAARHYAPKARLYAFEPLAEPAAVFRCVFADDHNVEIHQVAIGPRAERRTMNVAERDDSSSLLPISDLQVAIFPGTARAREQEVDIGPLDAYLAPERVTGPAMLKLDVQGFEYEALLGCESLLERFAYVYCECSFVELYSGQQTVDEIVRWLSIHQLTLSAVHNVAYDDRGNAVQADFLFSR